MAWPIGPFTSAGANMLNAAGAHIAYTGVSWPAHLEAMIPEGLQYQPVADLVGRIKSLGMNSIRLTWATEMVDDIFASGGTDVPLHVTLTRALGPENGSAVLGRILAQNPQFGPDTTRLEVFDAVARESAKQEIYVHLDNHVSRGGWCCNPIDGNTWWGDVHFDVGNWTRGLAYMANHSRSWGNMMSMALRNELRQPFTFGSPVNLYEHSYHWADWYKYMQQGAAAVHAANPDALLFLSGLDSDKDLSAVVNGTALTTETPAFFLFSSSSSSSSSSSVLPKPSTDTPTTFHPSTFANGLLANKLVFELHAYNFSAWSLLGRQPANCSDLTAFLMAAGLRTLTPDAPGVAVTLPLVITEFGFQQNATAILADDAYALCLAKLLPTRTSGWFYWSLVGSYYIREGVADHDEGWALLAHDGRGWRSQEVIDKVIRPMVKAAPVDMSGTVTGSSVGSTPSHNAAARRGSGHAMTALGYLARKRWP